MLSLQLQKFSAFCLFLAIASVCCLSTFTFAVPPEGASKTDNEPAANPKKPGQPYTPFIAPASNEAANALKRIKVPAGMAVNVWAAEPMVANPVSFGFDHTGRMYVCETFRQKGNSGVEDNRGHSEWLDDDLASTSIEDRLAYIKKHRPDQGASYTVEHDRLRLLTDTDGDGAADKETVFADGFNDILDGTGAGVLAHKGDVFYTCIPNLWRLRDKNNDGVSDDREKLATGFGVKFAFRGHDMHGLVIGPDGRLYFSIGDRGLNVITKEGRHLYNPDSGAVLRCELDGSNLELFCTGLRNPQELAFDDFGNLFTVDNNSDSGDKARLYHLIQGGDYGWRMYYQYLPDRGPWNREKLWHLPHEGQAAYVIPPIAHITDGPSGLVAYPGTGLGDEYQRAFFVCDFRGGPANSAVQMFKMEPDGATFKLAKYEPFLQNLLVTDCDFGPDGAFYVSDWIDGWDGVGKGRIYRVSNDKLKTDPRVAEVKKLLAEGFDHRPTAELCKLLEHADRRVRMGAQLALAEKKAIPELLEVAKSSKVQLARLHAVWGVGMWLRQDLEKFFEFERKDIVNGQQHFDAKAKIIKNYVAKIKQLVEDDDIKVASAATKCLSDNLRWGTLLGPPRIERPRFGKIEDIIQSDDPLAVFLFLQSDYCKYYMRNDIETLIEKYYKTTPIMRPSLRNAYLQLVIRGTLSRPQSNERPANLHLVLMDRQILSALEDADPFIVVEAARAYSQRASNIVSKMQSVEDNIYFVKIESAVAALIAKPYSGTPEQYDALFRRVLNANNILGTPENAAALAKYAARNDVPENLRLEALDILASWAKPSPRDRVTGQWRPIEARSAEPAAEALRQQIAAILSGPDKVRQKGAQTAGKLGVRDIAPLLIALYRDDKRPVAGRVAALDALDAVNASEVNKLIDESLASTEPQLRITARKLLAKRDPAAALPQLEAALATNSLAEQQAAIAALAMLRTEPGDKLLQAKMDDLLADKLAPELRLDVLEAIRARTERVRGRPRSEQSRPSQSPPEQLTTLRKKYDELPTTDEPLAKWRESAIGGDAERGRTIFFEKLAISCVRCHKIDDRGGEVGPNLSVIGKDKTRQYLLEALVDPNRAVAQGFETVVLEMNDGQVFSGIVKQETSDELTLIDVNAKLTTVNKTDIDARQKGQSSMPTDITKELTPGEARDLVEFLWQRRK